MQAASPNRRWAPAVGYKYSFVHQSKYRPAPAKYYSGGHKRPRPERSTGARISTIVPPYSGSAARPAVSGGHHLASLEYTDNADAEERARDMPAARIPDAIKTQVEERITAFNRDVLPDPNVAYQPRFRGAFLCLDRCGYGQVGPICRLRYMGAIDSWEFAIFKYSDDQYDPEEWLFPGSGQVDGTLEGAMRAGLAAYPL